MTQVPDDPQWLAALAGEPDPAADAKTNQQAAALRKALQARSARMHREVPLADQALYQRLLFRLRRERVTQPRSLWQRMPMWSLAATVVIGVAVVIQMAGPLGGDEERGSSEVLRGARDAVVMIVPDPETRLTELVNGLKSAGQEPKVQRISKGRIVLTVKATQPALDYLLTQRIEPKVKDGDVKLLLEPARPKP